MYVICTCGLVQKELFYGWMVLPGFDNQTIKQFSHSAIISAGKPQFGQIEHGWNGLDGFSLLELLNNGMVILF